MQYFPLQISTKKIIEFLKSKKVFLQFHQTIKTYLNHRVWQFYFYAVKSWPEDETPVFIHFPGCTSTPNNHESFGFFCPIDELDYVELLETENVLFNWSVPKYLNYTHGMQLIESPLSINSFIVLNLVDIVDRLEKFLKNIGKVERIQGDVFLCKNDPDCLKLGELPSNEAVNFA